MALSGKSKAISKFSQYVGKTLKGKLPKVSWIFNFGFRVIKKTSLAPPSMVIAVNNYVNQFVIAKNWMSFTNQAFYLRIRTYLFIDMLNFERKLIPRG